MSALPPLRRADELEAASAETIAAHLIWEIRRLIAERNWSQQGLATELGYGSAGSVSRWLTGKEPVPESAARRLDDLSESEGGADRFILSLDGVTFAELRERWRKARRFAAPKPISYDVFLASPMASATRSAKGGGYEAERDAAIGLVDALLQYCGFRRVYYAGSSIETTESFESPSFSVEVNAQALRESRYFALLALEAPKKPSGVYVEAGMALAMGKPSVYFVRNAAHLPWMLQTIGDVRSPLLPRVSVEPVESVSAAVGRLRKHRSALFSRLEAT